MPHSISATPEARCALARIKAEHGPVIIHIAGGCCDSRSPLCLPANELRLGAQDVLVGMIDDVAVYEMGSVGPPQTCARYILDLTPGTTIGFSLEAGQGLRFSLRKLISFEPEGSMPAGQHASGRPS